LNFRGPAFWRSSSPSLAFSSSSCTQREHV
jgi:hypothetical protein